MGNSKARFPKTERENAKSDRRALSGNFDASQLHLRAKSLGESRSIRDVKRMWDLTSDIQTHFMNGKFGEALEICCHFLSSASEKTDFQIDIACWMGRIYYAMENYDKSSECGEKIRVVLENESLKYSLKVRCLNLLAAIEFRFGKIDSALSLYQKIIELTEEETQLFQSDTFLEAMIGIGKIYVIQKKYDEAIKHFERILIIKNEREDDFYVNMTYCELAKIYLILKKGELLLRYLDRVKLNSEQFEMRHFFTTQLLSDVANLYEKIGNMESAVRCHEIRLDLLKSLFRYDPYEISIEPHIVRALGSLNECRAHKIAEDWIQVYSR
jgi:tetratricopeptide (TPR) repeat protein